MPNWVLNVLEVDGDAAEKKRFVEHAKSERQDLDFNRFKEVPKELIETAETHYPKSDPRHEERLKERAMLKEKYGFEGWYDWCVQNWGTKWNACEVEFNDEREWVRSPYYIFQTAWDAPVPIVLEMSRQFPNLEFSLESDEESGEFFYIKTFKGGVETSHEDLERENEEETE